jgi:hypothetical protein
VYSHGGVAYYFEISCEEIALEEKPDTTNMKKSIAKQKNVIVFCIFVTAKEVSGVCLAVTYNFHQ